MARTVMCPSRIRRSRPTPPTWPGFTRLANGLDLHAPAASRAHPLLPRRGAVPALALVLVAIAGWAGLLAWTRIDPVAAPCATCVVDQSRL
ncbi:hypothetical protein SAMN04487843_115133 [Methylobacterium sp. ap11]|uniref:hypothetical protein n=1 Tax=Methylobacterium sp. ap11 TaxID=1761799 RepID=UPI0008B72DA9|nr:hypothetical protein [Methylobacterium sp. ap11]SEP40215.1 hypothetical protein SAMN04487843_115133 [Methylobacterium sp. ap11]